MADRNKRYIFQNVKDDLARSMVFVSGPRQVGKSTLALNVLGARDQRHLAYFNWDFDLSRRAILKNEIPPDLPLIVFDELHKFPKWRNWIKGQYDHNRDHQNYLITGSARLDVFRRGGDSLQGRYHHWRLHPFSLRELDPLCRDESLQNLFKFGGFPEPLFRMEERFWRRWQVERLSRVIREDIRDLERVSDLSAMERLAMELPNRTSSPLSVKSLREDLEVSHDTVERWLKILESMYYCFRIPPYGTSKIRAVKKEQKLYLWDHSLIAEGGRRFENLVASQLLKYCHFNEDREGYRMELRFIRDIDKREVDFIVLQDGKPKFAVECKVGENAVSNALVYFSERIEIPKLYQVHMGSKDFVHQTTGIRILPFAKFCQELEMP